MESMMKRRTSVFVILVATLLVAGCATRGDMSELTSRLDAIDARLDEVDENLVRVGEAATAAETQAAAAALAAAESSRAADVAASNSIDAARKSEAIFDKSVRK
jgi:murein lipoprotein